jgi:hypothetical protein
MRSLAVPAPLRERLSEAASRSLMDMFVDAHTMATESFERRLEQHVSSVRVDIANLRADLLKWSFLFWIGQLAAITGVIGLFTR